MVKIKKSIFREYDIRGIAGDDLTPEFAELLGRAYGKYLFSKRSALTGTPKVSVGRDCRLSGDSYASGLIAGLTKAGLNVVNLGVCPTPLTYFSLFHLNLEGGIMITGSHNPADYNGFKVCLGKDTVHGKQIQELRVIMEELLTDNSPHGKVGELTEYAIIPAYIEYQLKIARPLKRKRIVLDSGNGTASTVAPILFEKLGAEVVPLFCELDGRFPNHHPDPTVPENLKQLIAKVKETKADLGIAFDGDADRVGLVDETGRIFYGDEIMVLFSRAVLKENPGATIISEVKSSHRLYDDIAAKGGKPLMWKTGHSLIKAKMKETGASLAGEMSGHIFFADRYFGFDDAIYAAIRLYEIACSTSATFSTLIEDLPKVVSTPEIRVDCLEEKKFELVAAVKRILQSRSHRINDIDGVRVDFGDGWGLVRASNTQPVLVLRFEAVSEQRILVLRAEVEGALAAAAKEIGHPDVVISA